MSAPLLTVDALNIAYRGDAGEALAVEDFSLRLTEGETYGLVGESGCGKSTAAYALLGHLAESGRLVRGSIKLEGREITELDEDALRQMRGRDIAMIYQEPVQALNPVLTIGRQLIEARRAHRKVDKQEAARDAIAMLARVRLGDAEAMMRRYPHQLSGGQAQRVVIAMALLAEPRLLVLDEPTTGLDATVEAGVVELIGELARAFGMGLLYISHNLGLVRRLCRRVGVMYAGRIVEEGSAEQIFGAPRHPYTQALLACRPRMEDGPEQGRLATIPGQPPAPVEKPRGCHFAPRCPHFIAGRCDDPRLNALREIGGGHVLRCARADEVLVLTSAGIAEEARAPAGAKVLGIEHLGKIYPPRNAFGLGHRETGNLPKANDDISLSLAKAEILSVVGESGSGKSTLARILIGLEEASEGRVILLGEDVARLKARHRPLKLIRALQMIFQNPDSTLNPAHRVGAIIGRAVKRLGGTAGRRETKARVAALLEQVRLSPDFAKKYPHELSGGQRQRVAIARAFAARPDIIIADEPVSALDVSVQAAIVNLLTDMQSAAGTTFLFISHDLALVRHLSDRVAVMFGGQIMELGTAQQVFSAPHHPYTEALLLAASDNGRELPGSSPDASPRFGAGCRYAGRCHLRIEGLCDVKAPPRQADGAGHFIFCHIPRERFDPLPVSDLQGDK